MNVLIFSVGSLGDIHPFVGLGRTLAARGHDVTVAVNGAFGELVVQAGLRHVAVGGREELEAVFQDEAYWHPYHGYQQVVERVILPVMRRQFEVIADLHKLGETIVVGSTNSIGARTAADKLGVPLVGVHVQPMVIWSEHRSPVVGPLLLGDRVPRPLKRWQYRGAESMTVARWMLQPANAHRAELDLPPFADMDDLRQAPGKVLGLFPDWFAPRQPDWPEQLELVGFPLWDDLELAETDPELEAFLEDDPDPPIVFTLSSTDWHAQEFYATAAESCRILGRRGILLSSDPANIPPALPDGVIHRDYVPFRGLLSRAAALVHHGGLGTSAQAMAAGIPQVTRPACFDQPDNAERLRRLGVSSTLRLRSFRPTELARALGQLLASSETARRCRAVAARLREDAGLERGCDAIERIAGVSTAPRPNLGS